MERSTGGTAWLQDFGLREREPGVLVFDGQAASADIKLIGALRNYARASERGRARVLFHGDEGDGLHEMMIAARRLTIWPPHVSEDSAKSWTVLDGEVAFVRYSPPGEIEAVVRLAADGVRGPFFFRLSAGIWHTIVPLSTVPVYLETTRGPNFGTRFADWGPQSGDDAAAETLRQAVLPLDGD